MDVNSLAIVLNPTTDLPMIRRGNHNLDILDRVSTVKMGKCHGRPLNPLL